MRFLYATDLHGSTEAYDIILDYAIYKKFKLLHIGADLLPKGSNMQKRQKQFINGYLKDFYKKAKDNGITILAFFGNDDFYTRKKYFREYAFLLDENPFEYEGWTFKAYPYVPINPYGLLNGCKYDNRSWYKPEPFKKDPYDFDDNGKLVKIEDFKSYMLSKNTIEEDLENIHADKKTIMSFHTPPSHILDTAGSFSNRRHIGSSAVCNWTIREHSPLILCGHAHENYLLTQQYKTYFEWAKSTIIQPGIPVACSARAFAVEININSNKIKAKRKVL